MPPDPAFSVDIVLARGTTRIATCFTASAGVTALVGRSGVGKTSVLDMIAGLLVPDAGRIMVAGDILFDGASGINRAPEHRACGYVFQDARLFPHQTVRGNLLYGRRRTDAARNLLTLDEACAFLGIGHLLDRWPRSLSGGEAQRVAIGRALLSGPQFLLLDEPLSALDTRRRAEIMAVIERIRDEIGLPILYVSHQYDELDRLATSIITMD